MSPSSPGCAQEETFASVDELIRQMQEDARGARERVGASRRCLPAHLGGEAKAIAKSNVRPRRHRHRSRSQRARLRGLFGHGGLARARFRTARRGRRRLRDGRIPSRLPQLDRGLHGQPPAAENHPRFEAARAWPAHRRAPRAEFLCRCRTAAISSPARAAPSARSQNSAPRMRPTMRPIRPRWAASAAVLRGLVLRAPPNLLLGNFTRTLGEFGKLAGDRQAAVAGRTASGRRSICSANRRAIRSIAGSNPIRSRQCSASTRSSATWRALTRRALLTCCCTTSFGEVNGKQGVWGHAIGGMGAITQAMAQGRRRTRRAHRSYARRCAK